MLITKFKIDYFGISDVGLVREHNEDMWDAYPEEGLFILADGMGGHSGGEVASREAVDYLARLVKEWSPRKETSIEEAMEFFRQAVAKVNTWVYEKGQSDAHLGGMGTTLCILYLLQKAAIVTHVGDSRVYRLRNEKLQLLTEDHSLVNELISIGAMKPEQGANFQYKHILTRAIGTHPKVEASINYTEIRPEDLFMLCSDGLTNFVTEAEIAHTLVEKKDLEMKCQTLVNLANTNSGGDNITVVLVETGHDLPR